MARPSRWKHISFDKGFKRFQLNSWKYFTDFINQEMLNYITYVYRGHASNTWKLEPTLDRIIKSPTSTLRESHLQRFKYETRGRRGTNPASLKDENDWWALGQHHGLATPLLDWTESPYVALFFAVSNAVNTRNNFYSVFAISQASIDTINDRILKNNDIPLVNGKKQTVKIVRPLSDENSRLVNQRGLFTRGPNNVDLESWIQSHHENEEARFMDLIKIDIPNNDSLNCLKYLNRMNINHSTLFPDLSGASRFCNSHLKVTDY